MRRAGTDRIQSMLTIISPSSDFGIFAISISLTATVSPVAQLRAPSLRQVLCKVARRIAEANERTVYLSERALAKRVAELL